MANLVDSRFSGSDVMFLVKAAIIAFLTASLISDGLISSQTYPNVVKEANLILVSVLSAFEHRLGMSSSHSPLGISIEAIEARIEEIYLLTLTSGDASVANIAIFIWSLNSLSRLIHISAYLASFDLFEMKFL